MSAFQTLLALLVLIFVLSVIVQAVQEVFKSFASTKAKTMAETIDKFMGNCVTLPQVQAALKTRGLDITALEHFNKEDFRHLLDGIELAAPQVQGVVASATATFVPFSAAAPRHWVATRMRACAAVIRPSLTTRAGIGTAPSARPKRASVG